MYGHTFTQTRQDMMGNGQLPSLYDKEAYIHSTLDDMRALGGSSSLSAGSSLSPASLVLLDVFSSTLDRPPDSTAESREQSVRAISSAIEYVVHAETERMSAASAKRRSNSISGINSIGSPGSGGIGVGKGNPQVENASLKRKIQKLEEQAVADAEALVQAQVKYVDYVTVCEENENLMKMVSETFAKHNRIDLRAVSFGFKHFVIFIDVCCFLYYLFVIFFVLSLFVLTSISYSLICLFHFA